ncbi:uracil phosphoribosyltransferase [Pseudoalteromonas sp. T1lg122]|uniref:uracil phosphoribosyltransferase n=1 Tax=Pseudoalteromonas sp. T1lg122 TaxID=2077094 RepID=UPI000CF73942|nr:uracil phosphoribosyltransferase [Pseudoalteromonas sp. T1lg122]
MSVTVLETKLSPEIKALIEHCKSSSKTTGYKLREAHYNLGQASAENLVKTDYLNQKHFSVLVMMRAGLKFALGISDMLEKMGKVVDIHFLNNDLVTDDILTSIKGKQVLIVDAVINSGKSILSVINQLPEVERKKSMLFTTVMPSSSVELLPGLKIFTVRLSDNKYTGAKVSKIQGNIGPDTGDRLFGTL